MEETINIDIWTALIGGFFVVVSPIISHFIKLRWDQRKLSSKRNSEIRGDWKGFMTQQFYGNKTDAQMPISAHFDVKGKTINCEILLDFDDFSSRLEGRGNFPHDDFFIINYSSKDERKKQFGCFVAHFGPTGNEIIGKFSGYGHLNDRLVSGDFKIDRVN